MVVTRNLSQNSGVASAANPSESPNKLTTPRVHNNAPSTATMKKNQHMKHLQCRYHDYCSIPPEAVKWTPILAGLFPLFLPPSVSLFLHRCAGHHQIDVIGMLDNGLVTFA